MDAVKCHNKLQHTFVVLSFDTLWSRIRMQLTDKGMSTYFITYYPVSHKATKEKAAVGKSQHANSNLQSKKCK